MDASTVQAKNNYYGGDSPSYFEDEESSILWSPYLTTDPCSGSAKIAMDVESVDNELASATPLSADKKLAELLWVISEEPASAEAGHATIELGRMCKEGGRSILGEIEAIHLEGLVAPIFRWGGLMVCHENLGDVDQALAVAGQIAAEFAWSPLEFVGTFSAYQLNRDAGRLQAAADALVRVRAYTDLQRDQVEWESADMRGAFGKVETTEENRATVDTAVEAFPNPFNPAVTMSYVLPMESHVRLKIFDALGREVARLVDETKPAGRHEVVFDGSSLPTGVYVYRLSVGEAVRSGSLVLLK